MNVQESTSQPDAINVSKVELQDELSWLMQRVHRLRKLLGLDPIVTPRQKKRRQRKSE
jgi:hypothetical protein